MRSSRNYSGRIPLAALLGGIFVLQGCTGNPTDLSACVLQSEVEVDFGTGVPDPTVAGPTLESGVEYRITVSGTYSIWTSEWSRGACKGTPAAGAGGPTGLDAEYWFAIPVGSVLCGSDFACCPNHNSRFRMSLDGGGSFTHIEPVAREYNPAHVYEYRVQGQGMPVHFMIRESSARGDDYGILHIQIACAAAARRSIDRITMTTSTGRPSAVAFALRSWGGAWPREVKGDLSLKAPVGFTSLLSAATPQSRVLPCQPGRE